MSTLENVIAELASMKKAKDDLEDIIFQKDNEIEKLKEAKMTIEDTMIDTENKEEDLIDKLTEEVKYLRENVDKLTEENLELKRDIRNKDLCITKLIISPDQKDLEEFRKSDKNNARRYCRSKR